MIKAFGGKQKLKGARNYCEVSVLDQTTCTHTGAPQPPGTGQPLSMACVFILAMHVGLGLQSSGLHVLFRTQPLSLVAAF